MELVEFSSVMMELGGLGRCGVDLFQTVGGGGVGEMKG